jgi:hypothetical protein
MATTLIDDLLKASRARAGVVRVQRDIGKAADLTKPKRKKGRKQVNWRIDPNNFRAPTNPEFVPGSVEFSPGWFSQGHEARTIIHLTALSTFLMTFTTETC